MFCSHCGKEVTVRAKFCPNCGAAIESQPTPAEERPNVSTGEQTENLSKKITIGGGQSGKGKKGTPKPLIIVAAVLVLFIGFGSILNLFEGDDKPVSGSGDSGGLDWVEGIPRVSGSTRVITSVNDTGIYLGLSKESITPYSELKNIIGPDFDYLGAPNDSKIEYYASGSTFCTGVSDGQIVYWASEGINGLGQRSPMGELTVFPQTEPVIVKNEDEVYYLCFRNDNSYNIFVAKPSDPNSSYLTWTCFYFVMVSNIEYCDLLNGTQELEIVSIPGENSDDKINSVSGEDKNEAVIHSAGTVPVETDYYSVEIPNAWEQYCSYEEISGAGDYRLVFRIKDEYMEDGCDSTLLELAAIENSESLNSEQYHYICQICEYRAVLFDLMHWAPDDVQVQEEYRELLTVLQDYIPYVIQSIKAKNGYTLSYESIEVNSSAGTHFLQVRDNAILSGSFANDSGEIISFFPTSLSLFSSDVDLMWNEKRVCHLSYQEYQNTSDAEVFSAYNRQVGYLEDEMTVEYWKDADKVVITGSKQFDGEYYRYYEGVYSIPFSAVKTNMVGGVLSTDKYKNSYKYEFFHVGMNGQDYNWYSRYQDQEIVATDSSGNVVLRYLTVSQSLDFGDRYITVAEFDPPSVEPLIIEGELTPSYLIYECENAYIILVTSHSGDGNYMTDYVLTATYASNTDFYVTY